MGIDEADWKNQPRQILDWIILIVGSGMLAVYAYLWWVEAELYLGMVSLLFVAGILYFTAYWQPVLYLVLSVVIATLTFIWFIDGSWRQSLVQIAIFFNGIFILLSIYLFINEEKVE